MAVVASAFSRLSRDAKAWLERPSEGSLAVLAARARAATPHVPEARRADWERLVAGFSKTEAGPRRRARVEGLVRACSLFAPEREEPSPRETPLRWEDPVDVLPGLGATAKAQLGEAGIRSVADLVWTLPASWDDLRHPSTIAEAAARADAFGQRVCVRGIVKSAGIVPLRGRRGVRVVLRDAEGGATLHAWWFFTAHGVLSLARPGAACLLVGRVRVEAGRPVRMTHPDIVLDTPEARVARPRYPRLGPPEATLRKAIRFAIERLPSLPDPVPSWVAAREGLEDVSGLLRAVSSIDGGVPSPGRVRAAVERLAWAEAFARVWARTRQEAATGPARAPALPLDPTFHARFVAELGFSMTEAQERAIREIGRELASEEPMRRLLLGDVGTGKTAVAMAAVAQCVAAGFQAALLVPTSILAEQYLDAAAPLARATGASVALITAGVPTAQRRRAAEGAASGELDVIVGTHALLDEGLGFARLGLVVVDEQHRLGVAQRLSLVSKGGRPHLLTLSATPIPRTLALALRGELATSVLDERPRGRPPVTTELVPRAQFESVIAALREVCERGERAFFITPRIDEGDEGDPEMDLPTVEARTVELSERLGPARVLAVHGGLNAEAKRRVMRAFRRGEGQVLVGTTVLEVGVDVPEATLMVVDGAEQFGLAQLHQLRGRVGRGERPGRCLLVHDTPLTPQAHARLNALREHADGATIARIDLELRGAGDLGGTRQSGAELGLVYLDPASPPDWLARIEDDARRIAEEDPDLVRPEHHALRLALGRFQSTLAIREEAG